MRIGQFLRIALEVGHNPVTDAIEEVTLAEDCVVFVLVGQFIPDRQAVGLVVLAGRRNFILRRTQSILRELARTILLQRLLVALGTHEGKTRNQPFQL